MTELFIAEKRSAGETLAAHLSKARGLPARAFATHAIVGDTIVAWARGHLLELLEPEEYDPAFKNRDNFSVLPIIPEAFQLKPVENSDRLLANLKNQLKSATRVIHFGDPGDEGQLIVDEILNYFKYTKPVERLWVRALDDASLAKGLANITDNANYLPISHAASARRVGDWLYGINMSRAVTISARLRGAWANFTVGRVQTPTLALVINVEFQIRNFVPRDYFEPWIEVATTPVVRAKWVAKDPDPRVDHEGLLSDKQAAEQIVAAAVQDSTATVVEYKSVPGSMNAALPFSLSALQVYSDQLFGYAPDETLAFAVSLYDKKIVSYPRTSCDYLPESQHAEAASILTSLARSSLPPAFATALRGAKFSLKSRAWEDKACEEHDHHAIVPVHLDDPTIIDTLTVDEKRIYGEIVKRYILQFWPAAQFMETTILFDAAGELYKVSGKRFTDDGWRKAFAPEAGSAEAAEAAEAPAPQMPLLKDGDVVSLVDVGFASCVTKPPQRFTRGTLLGAMKNIHRYVQDPNLKARLKLSAGIGTEATRSDIILNLFKKNYLDLNGKYVVPTIKGTKMIGALPLSMTSPDMTAMWQAYMDGIKAGLPNVSFQAFIDKQIIWLRDMVAASKTFFVNTEFPAETGGLEIRATEFSCSCGSPLRHINGKYGWFFGCSNKECKKNYQDNNGVPTERVPNAPVADSGFPCPLCNMHSLVRRTKRDNSGHWWSCPGWKSDKTGCNASYNDLEGVPDFDRKSNSTKEKTSVPAEGTGYANGPAMQPAPGPARPERVNGASASQPAAGHICPACQSGTLVRIPCKDSTMGYFWSCNKWREGCKATFSDEDGNPDIQHYEGGGTGSGIGRGAAGSPGATRNSPAPVGAATGGNRFLAAVAGRGAYGGKGK